MILCTKQHYFKTNKNSKGSMIHTQNYECREIIIHHRDTNSALHTLAILFSQTHYTDIHPQYVT